eukprot:g48073.t1
MQQARMALVKNGSVGFRVIEEKTLAIHLIFAPYDFINLYKGHRVGADYRDNASVGKLKELIIDFRKKGGEHAPIYINRIEDERVESIKFLIMTITDNLSWTSHINATVKKAQHLFFLKRLRKFGMSIRSLINFYRCTIES